MVVWLLWLKDNGDWCLYDGYAEVMVIGEQMRGYGADDMVTGNLVMALWW